MTTDDKEIVSAMRAALADRVGEQRFDLWFGSGTRLEFDGEQLVVGVPNKFFLDWIRSSFRREIEEACCQVLQRTPPLLFRVDATPCPPQVESMQATRSNSTDAKQLSRRSVAGRDPATESLAPPARANGVKRRKFASLDRFVQGESNSLAWASVRRAAREPGELTPLLVYGPTGVGKTHLLEGAFTTARRRSRDMSVVYLSAEQFTTYFLEALRGSGLPNFRQKYRGVGLLILEDLHFLIGKRATQIELLHTIDTLLRDGRQIIFSADRAPADLTELGPELISRLQGGMICRIERPDYATRLGIVESMVARMQIEVPTDVRRFIAGHLTNDAREFSGALCRLQATAEATGQPITMAMTQDALAEMIRDSGRLVRLDDIERAVCDVFGLEPSTLHSNRKAKTVSHPRMLAMWLARKHTRAALSEIGHYFGRRSHSTVISAQKRVDRWMTSGVTLDARQRTWNIDEVIRQVERQLAVG